MAKVGSLIETADAYEFMSGYQNLVLASRFYPSSKALPSLSPVI
jgi:ABC-2 type transport system ATP-binding protein